MSPRFLLLLLPLTALAIDWPQWRGPARDGVLTAPRAPWPEKLNKAWQVTVGEGHSSPISAAGKLFVFAREGGNEVLTALDPASGKVLWKQSYTAPYKMNPAATSHGEGPKSTPLFASGKVFTLGINGILTAWEAASGKTLWRKSNEASPLYGTATSPTIEDGLLIVFMGGHGSGALTAYDPNTGAEKWKWAGDGPGYSSPVIGTFQGVKQIVTQSQDNVVSVDLKSGALLWKLPYTTDYTQNAVSPLIDGDTVVISGLNKGITKLKPVKKGTAWEAERVWHTADASFYMNTPVKKGDIAFGLANRNKGMYTALDLKSGKVLWRSNPRQGDNAAIVLSGDVLLALSSDSELVVAKAGPDKYEELRRYTVRDSPTWAHPLVTEAGVIVKDRTTVALWK